MKSYDLLIFWHANAAMHLNKEKLTHGRKTKKVIDYCKGRPATKTYNGSSSNASPAKADHHRYLTHIE